MGRKDIRNKINNLLEEAFTTDIFTPKVFVDPYDITCALCNIKTKSSGAYWSAQAYFSYISGFKTTLIDSPRFPISSVEKAKIYKILNELNKKTIPLRKAFYETCSGKEMIVEELKKKILVNYPGNIICIESYISPSRNTHVLKVTTDSYKVFKLTMEKGFQEDENNEILNKINKDTAVLRFFYMKDVTSKKDLKGLISFPE